MLNPDGVYVGNYRTGIIGVDFNRNFESGKKDMFPEVHALKQLVSETKKSGKVLLFLDLHGHSILKNSFIYGPSLDSFVNHPRNPLLI
jgi:murein tripeptide amidase MpaA